MLMCVFGPLPMAVRAAPWGRRHHHDSLVRDDYPTFFMSSDLKQRHELEILWWETASSKLLDFREFTDRKKALPPAKNRNV